MNKIDKINIAGTEYSIDGIISVDIDQIDSMYNSTDHGVYKIVHDNKSVGILFINNIVPTISGGPSYVTQVYMGPYKLTYTVNIGYTGSFQNQTLGLNDHTNIQTRHYNSNARQWSVWKYNTDEVLDTLNDHDENIIDLLNSSDEYSSNIQNLYKKIDGYISGGNFIPGVVKSVELDNQTIYPDYDGKVNLTGIIEDGKNAYELAVDKGYQDTEENWLNSLHGKSAYEIWLEQGNTGSVEVFLASLKESGFTTKAVATRPSAIANIDEKTIYAIPDNGGESWSEYIYVGNTSSNYDDSMWLKLATHDGSGLSSMVTDIKDLKDSVNELEIAKSLFTEVDVLPDNYENANVDDNMYIDKDGNMQSLIGAHIRSYQVLKGEKYRLTLQYPQNNQFASLVFALYNNPIYSSASLVEKSQRWIDLTNEETLEVKIQQNGYLAVVPFANNFVVNVKLVTYKNKIDDVEEELAEVEERLSDYDNLYVKDEEKITSDIYNVEDGKYITNTGAIADFSMYELLYFPVNSGDKYTIRMENGPSAGGVAYIYAFYNTVNPYDFNTGSKIGTIGPSVNVITYNQEITVPDGAVCMALTRYKGGGNYLPATLEIFKANDVFFPEKQEQLNETFETDIESLRGVVNEIKNQSNGNICVELSENGENLYIAFLDGTTEITYWFKRCMANELFTFYRVGYRTVERSHPDTDGISTGSGITYINKTSSDNIGPLLMTNGNWVGGNHTYADGSVLTAENVSYTCYAGDKILNAGDKVSCDSVVVKVINTIYDPAIAPEEGDEILSTPLCTESVAYVIRKNTIEVSLKHQFVNDTNNAILMYYGMQSMFDGEEYIMTPNGEFTDWNAISSSTVDFNKSDYPLFNRFIEKSTTKGTYQAAYLYGNKLGSHGKIPNTAWIFQRSSSKCYHHLMQSVSNIAGKSFTWNGAYTFFHTPLRDDSDIFAYFGVINGKDALFINTKQSCDISINLPEKFLTKKMTVVEISDTITTPNSFVDIDGIDIEASDVGSLILMFD